MMEAVVVEPALTETLTHRSLDENQGTFAHDWIASVNARVYDGEGIFPEELLSFEVTG